MDQQVFDPYLPGRYFISEQKTAFIASVNEQGYLVVRAMLAPRKIENGEIYFSTNTSSKKVKQYIANNKACEDIFLRLYGSR